MTEDRTTDDAATPADLAQHLGVIAAELDAAKTEIERQDLWRRARKVLSEAGANSTQVDRAIGRRSALALSRFAEELKTRGFEETRSDQQTAAGDTTRPHRRTGASPTPSAAAAAAAPGPTADELKKAIRAFKKRIKLTRLNEESKLGRSPMTSGKKSNVVAIMPPYGYRPEIWEALVAEGRLRHTGRGFYELVEGGGAD